MSFNVVPAFPNVPETRVPEFSSVAPVEFQGRLHIYFTSAINDSIWCMTATETGLDNELKYSTPYDIVTGKAKRITVADGTSPAVIVLGNVLFIFFNGSLHGLGDNGTFYMKRGYGNIWTTPEKVHDLTIMSGTSPSAVVYGGKIHVFWADEEGAIRCDNEGTISQWETPVHTIVQSPPASPIERPCHDPCAVVFDGELRVFYNIPLKKRPMYKIYSRETQTWMGPFAPGSSDMQPGSLAVGTRPTAIELVRNQVLRLFWTGDDLHLNYVDYRKDLGIWTMTRKFSQVESRKYIYTTSSVSYNQFGNLSNLFCIDYHDYETYSICCASGLVYEVGVADFETPARWIRDERSFLLTVRDPQINQLLFNRLSGQTEEEEYEEFIESKAYGIAASRIIQKIWTGDSAMPASLAAKISIALTLFSIALATSKYAIAIRVNENMSAFHFVHEDA